MAFFLDCLVKSVLLQSSLGLGRLVVATFGSLQSKLVRDCRGRLASLGFGRFLRWRCRVVAVLVPQRLLSRRQCDDATMRRCGDAAMNPRPWVGGIRLLSVSRCVEFIGTFGTSRSLLRTEVWHGMDQTYPVVYNFFMTHEADSVSNGIIGRAWSV